MVFQNGFLPLIQKATRVTRTRATAIDHILTDRALENKIQSGIIKTDISDHFPINDISDKQFGFRKGHSTEHALIELVNRIYD